MRKTIIILLLSLFAFATYSAVAAESAGFSFGGSSGSTSSGGAASDSDHGGYSESDAPQDLTDSIFNEWLCVRWMISGWCYEEYVVVTHYFPVAYITTPVKKDDSKSGSSSKGSSSGGGASSSSSSSGSSSSSSSSGSGSLTGGTQTRVKRDGENMSMAWEAIVWQITDEERDDALEDWDSCLCEFTENSGGGSSMTSSDSGTCDSYDSDSSSEGSSGGGSSSGGSSGGGSGSSGSSSGSSDREVYYNSSKDGNNWREGCRDLTKGSSSGVGLGGGTGSNPFASDSSYSIHDCKGTPVPDFNSQMDESCLGSWGALYPRYTFTSGTTELISSMKIAYRAAHIASNTLSKMPHPVDKQGIMQQVDPKKTACMNVGATPLLVDFIAGVKMKGQYSWIYWKKVGCCKSMSEVSECSGK